MDFAIDLDIGLIFIVLLPILGAALIGGGIIAHRGSHGGHGTSFQRGQRGCGTRNVASHRVRDHHKQKWNCAGAGYRNVR